MNWIKIPEDFFEDDRMVYLASQQDGEKHLVVWMKILLRCVKSARDHESDLGVLRLGPNVTYDETFLATLLRTDVRFIRVSFKLFGELGMIEWRADGTLVVPSFRRFFGAYSPSTDRVRRYRERKKAKETDETVSVTLQETLRNDIDIDIDIEKEKDTKRRRVSTAVFRPPTVEEVRAYCVERRNRVDAQHWFDHYTSNGWRVGKNPMKDWKATVRTWERSEYSTGSVNTDAESTLDKKLKEMGIDPYARS